MEEAPSGRGLVAAVVAVVEVDVAVGSGSYQLRFWEPGCDCDMLTRLRLCE